MRIGVISDTHRNLHLAREAIRAMGKIDLLIHAGDHYSDAIELAEEFGLEVKSVIGNCDFPGEGNAEELISINDGEFKIFVVHGHQYGVKSGLEKLYYRGLELEADIIVFGHTHLPLLLKEDDVTLLNPGSIGFPRANEGLRYGLIEVGQDLQVKLENV